MVFKIADRKFQIANVGSQDTGPEAFLPRRMFASNIRGKHGFQRPVFFEKKSGRFCFGF